MELAGGLAVSAIGALVMVIALMGLLTSRNFIRSGNLEAQLISQHGSLEESICGPRPEVSFWAPYHTNVRLQAYNACLALYMARPTLLRSFFYTFAPMFIAIIAVAVIWLERLRPKAQPSPEDEFVRAWARV